MIEIPENIIEDVNKITEELIKYKNDKNLSWTSSYKEILTKLNMQEKNKDIKLLSYVVTNLTRLGYDIEGIPFKLIKYK